MKRTDVICIGNAAVDVPLYYVDEKIFTTDSYMIERIVPMVGGSGLNVSTVLTHLGKKVKLVTMLGNDMLGDFLIEHCLSTGIDVTSIIRSNEVDTPLSIGIVKKDGERSFIVSKSSSTFHLCSDDIDKSVFKGAKILDIASIFIMPRLDCGGLIEIFREAKHEGLLICADMMKSRIGERLDAISSAFPYVDYFFANYDEASFITELSDKPDIADKLIASGVKHVIIKDGKRGCYIKSSDRQAECPAFINKDLVDTIGAGDNFTAGFITGILDGLSFVECAYFANATASISVGATGATAGVKTKQQVLDLFNSKT